MSAATGALRLFVALPVPAHVEVLADAAAAPARAAHPELTWTRPEGWHVTLAFLGAVPGARTEHVEHVVTGVAAAHAPITCHLGPAGRFDHRALWLTVEDRPAGAIAELGGAVQVALEAAGLPVQRRAVRPHLTLARSSRRRVGVPDGARALVAPVAATWDADEVALVRSHLGDGPARYELLRTWPLGGHPTPS